MRTSKLNLRQNKVAYAVTVAVILMFQSSVMTAQARESLIGQQTETFNPQYSNSEVLWLLNGSNLMAQNNTLSHKKGTLAPEVQQLDFYHIGLENGSVAQATENSVTLSDTTLNFSSTPDTEAEFDLINVFFYDSKNVSAYDNTFDINHLELSNGSVWAYDVVMWGADTVDAAGNSFKISDVTMTSAATEAAGLFDITAVEAAKDPDSSEKAVYRIDDTKLTLDNILIDQASAPGEDGEDLLAVAVRVYDANEVSSKGNTVYAKELDSRSAMLAGVRVQGDETESVTLSENELHLTDSHFTEQLDAYGARAAIAGSAEISNNLVEISNISAGSLRLYGGRYYQTEIPTTDTSVSLIGNQLLISDTEVSGSVDLYGARASASSSVSNSPEVEANGIQMNDNQLTLKDSLIGDYSDIYAAYSRAVADVEMNSNVLTVSNVQFTGEAFHRGAQATGENVSMSGNRLIVNGQSVFNQGANLVASEALGNKSVSISNSSLEIDGATFKRDAASDLAAVLVGSKLHSIDAQVRNSEVNISNADFQRIGLINGAWVVGKNLSTQNVTVDANKLSVSDDSLIVDIFGTNIQLTQGGTLTSERTSVKVRESNLLSGFVFSTFVQASGDNRLRLNNQTIQISDSTVQTVSGMYLDLENADSNVFAEMNGLTVSLNNSTVLGGVYTGYTSDEASGQSVTSSTVAVKNSRLELSGANRIGGVRDFDTFAMNVQEVNKDKALLTITGAALNSQKHFDDLTIELTANDFVTEPDTYRLIQVEGNDRYVFSNLKVQADQTFVQTTYTATDDIVLSAADIDTLTSKNELFKNKTVQATSSSKTLSSTLLGSVAFVNQGAEFIADEGLESMAHAATDGAIATFGAVHGGSSHYKVDPRVDVDGYSLAAGAATKVTPDWILGGFIEAGWADSDNHVQGSKAEGEHDYYGLGVATRYKLNDSWYVDGSLRFGRASTEFTGSYVNDSAKYDSDSFYVSAHAATGYVFDLTDSVKLDLYGRYVVTYLDGDEVNLHNRYKQTFDMDSTVTHALRLGSRMTGSFCPYADWKVGLAYERVFDGDAESTVNNLNLEVPSLEGNTGIMEVGVSMKPNLNSHWTFNLGAKGYVGDREGVIGNAVIRYTF